MFFPTCVLCFLFSEPPCLGCSSIWATGWSIRILQAAHTQLPLQHCRSLIALVISLFSNVTCTMVFSQSVSTKFTEFGYSLLHVRRIVLGCNFSFSMCVFKDNVFSYESPLPRTLLSICGILNMLKCMAETEAHTWVFHQLSETSIQAPRVPCHFNSLQILRKHALTLSLSVLIRRCNQYAF